MMQAADILRAEVVATEPEIAPVSLSVFFPAYNDAPSLPSLLETAFAVLEETVADFEVIVVNDGSRDDTARVLEDLQTQYGPALRVVTHARNRGYGGALRSGFAAATKDFVFYTDGDGQYDVRDLPRLLAALEPDTGLVNGYKILRHDPRHRIWIGAIYNQFARLLFRVKLRDIDCDFRLIRRSVLQQFELTSTSGTICLELVKKIELSGTRLAEVPVGHYQRLHGRSQFFRLRSLSATMVQLLCMYWNVVIVPWGRALSRRTIAKP